MDFSRDDWRSLAGHKHSRFSGVRFEESNQPGTPGFRFYRLYTEQRKGIGVAPLQKSVNRLGQRVNGLGEARGGFFWHKGILMEDGARSYQEGNRERSLNCIGRWETKQRLKDSAPESILQPPLR